MSAGWFLSYGRRRQSDGQSSRGPHLQIQLLLPQIVKLHALRDGLGLNLNTHTHTISHTNTEHVTNGAAV